MDDFNLKRIVKLKVQSQLNENISIAKSKCNQAIEILEYAFEDKNLPLIEKAVSLFGEAIELYSKFVEPYIALAYIFWKMGMYSEAQKFINKALELEPFNKEAQVMLKSVKDDFESSLLTKNTDNSLMKFLDNSKKDNTNSIFSGFMTTINKIFKNNNARIVQKKNNDFSTIMAETAKKMNIENK
jgi:tetratricopeptide (TPR) repeat protein